MSASLAIDTGALALPEPDAAGVRVYKGVPFAAPPRGEKRWRAPEPVAPWSGVRESDAFGPSAMQGKIWDDIHLPAAGVSEDCLNLNVWTPASPGDQAKLPVFYWVHGGGFAAGAGSEPRYGGAKLAARGIVVVTVNMRLGAFGFLAHPELTAEAGYSGNYGLLDLVAGLEWVKRNIGAFGGDPSKVTIGGESAGSMAVSGLMASPLARGLFRGCIGESGALFPALVEPMKTREAAERQGVEFFQKLGVRTLAEARALPSEAILKAAPGLGYRPIVDGRFLPKTAPEIFAAREQSDVPLMAGWNKDEGFNFTLAPDTKSEVPLERILGEVFGERAAAARSLYPGGAAARASAAQLGADIRIVHKTWGWLEAQRRSGKAPVWRFQFERCPLTPEGWFGERDSKTAGAFHAGEINYVFDTLDVYPWLIDDADRAIVTTTTGYWLNFIKTLDPNGPGLPPWPSYRETPEQVMHIDGVSAAQPATDRARQEFLAAAARG